MITDTQYAPEDGGVDWELTEAIRLMGEAVASGDPDLIATAMRRHAEALSNQAYKTLVPTLKQVLETVVKKEIGLVSQSITSSVSLQDQRFNYVLDQLGAFLKKEDMRHDQYGTELSVIIETLGGLKASQDDLQAGFHEVDSSIAGLRVDVKHVQEQSHANGDLISQVKEDVLGVMHRVESMNEQVVGLLDRVNTIEENADQLRTDVDQKLLTVGSRLDVVESRLTVAETKIALHDQLIQELQHLESARARLRGRREAEDK